MLPNVRLLIAALFSSVVALSCGFGVFAALRVNSDPLGRLPAGAAALQLVANEAAAAPATWGAPFGSGLHSSEAQIGGVATDAPPVSPGRGASEPLIAANAWTAGTVRADAATNAVLVHAAQPSPILAVTIPPASAVAPVSEPTTPKAPETGPTIPPIPITNAAAPTPALASTASAPDQPPPAAETHGLEPAPDVKKTAEDEPTALAVPAVAAIEPAASPAPPAAQPADATGTVPDAAAPDANLPEKLTREPERRTPRKLARKPIERQRVAKKRVLRKTKAPHVAQIGDGISTFQEPVFQTAPDAFQRPQVPNRRGSKTAAQNDVPSDSFVWPNGR